jgi:hypothetical protein
MTLVTWLQDGHSYAMSPGSFPTGAILTTSSIGALQRGQATLLRGSSDTTPRIQAMFTLGQTRRSFFGCVTRALYGRKLSAKKKYLLAAAGDRRAGTSESPLCLSGATWTTIGSTWKQSV